MGLFGPVVELGGQRIQTGHSQRIFDSHARSQKEAFEAHRPAAFFPIAYHLLTYGPQGSVGVFRGYQPD